MQANEDQQISLFVRILGIYFLALILGAINIGGMGSALKIFGFLPVLLWVLNRKSIYSNHLYYGVVFYTYWAALSTFWSINFSLSISRCITLASFCLLLMAASSYDYSSAEIQWLKNMLVWSSRITVAAALLSGNYEEGRLYFSGVISEDPNYLCGYFLFGAVDCFIVLFEGRKNTHRLLRIIELVFYAYAVLATGSRGGAIAVSCALVCSLCITLFRQQLSLKMIVGRIAVIGALAIGFIIVTNYVSADVLARFSADDVMESGGSGRFETWTDTLNAFINSDVWHQIAGYGAATSMAASKAFQFHREQVSHNAYIENLIEMGIVGILLYLVYVLKFAIYAFKKNDPFSLSVIVGFMALAVSTSIYAFKPFWNIMIYICCLSQSSRIREQNQRHSNLANARANYRLSA